MKRTETEGSRAAPDSKDFQDIDHLPEARGRAQGSEGGKSKKGFKNLFKKARSFTQGSSSTAPRAEVKLDTQDEETQSLDGEKFSSINEPSSGGNGNNTPPHHTPTPPPPESGHTPEEIEAFSDSIKKARSTLVLRKNLAEKWVRPRVELKEQVKGKLESKLKTTMDDLKTKVKNTKNHQKVADIQELIRGQFDGLAFKPSKEKLGEFNNWFDKMLDSQKNAFPEDNWVWHDVIRPALMVLLGVIFTVATAAIRPFVEGVGTYANLFFQKPDTEGFKELKQAALKVKEETELSLPGLGG